MKKLFLIAMLAGGLASAQSPEHAGILDSTRHHVKWYASPAIKSVLAPAMLVAYGVATIGNREVIVSSSDVKRWRQKEMPHFKTDADDYMPSASLVLMYSLDIAGVKSSNTWYNQSVMFFLANGLNGLLTKRIKHNTLILRPDGSDHLSFPSAHTSSAFLAAEMLHQEFKEQSPWISIAGYTLASAVGAMRIMNNKHWLSDVVAGAGIGIFSVRLTYLVYPLIYRKITRRPAKGLL
jgi:hypothetical protein